MGSYLRNCFISNQIIPSDSEVIVIPIIQQAGYHQVELESSAGKKVLTKQAYKSRCYPNSLWEPLGLKFPAEADDSYRTTIKSTNEFNDYSIILFLESIYQKAFNFKITESDKKEVLKVKKRM